MDTKLINRDDVIDAWCERVPEGDREDFRRVIRNLPTVEDKELYQRGFRAGQEEIFRRAKIDEIFTRTVEVRLLDDKTLWVKVGNVEQIGRVIVEDGSIFCRVFYADRAKGEWIDCSEDGYIECPFCHEATNCDGNISELHYCWNCGAELKADMREEE